MKKTVVTPGPSPQLALGIPGPERPPKIVALARVVTSRLPPPNPVSQINNMNTDEALREKSRTEQEDSRGPEATTSTDKEGHHNELECSHQLTSSFNDSDSDSSVNQIDSSVGMKTKKVSKGSNQPVISQKGPPLKLQDGDNIDASGENSRNIWSITWHTWPGKTSLSDDDDNGGS